MIFGVAAATGRTMVGTQGWRAERAEVRALYLGSDRPCRELRAVEARYGVPVYRDLETMVAEWTGELELEAVA